MYLLIIQRSTRVVPTLSATSSSFTCAASLITTLPQAMHTEAVGAGDTGAVLAGDGATHAMQSDAAVTTSATTTGGGVQARPASPISAATHDTMPPEQPDRSHLQHVAAVAAAPVRGINPVDSAVDQVGMDVTLSPSMPAGALSQRRKRAWQTTLPCTYARSVMHERY
jgi:hypothetical protein